MITSKTPVFHFFLEHHNSTVCGTREKIWLCYLSKELSWYIDGWSRCVIIGCYIRNVTWHSFGLLGASLVMICWQFAVCQQLHATPKHISSLDSWFSNALATFYSFILLNKVRSCVYFVYLNSRSDYRAVNIWSPCTLGLTCRIWFLFPSSSLPVIFLISAFFLIISQQEGRIHPMIWLCSKVEGEVSERCETTLRWTDF